VKRVRRKPTDFGLRLWRKDGMRWVMAPTNVKPGDRWQWADNKCRAVTDKGQLRYEDVK
jgi:hypothetical protein